MQWWKRLRKATEHPKEDEQMGQDARTGSFATPIIRDAERRRLRRLLERRRNIEYDIGLAERALQPENRWTERIGQLDEAIAQAEVDLRALAPEPREQPAVALPETPIEVVSVSPAEPASVVLRVGEVTLSYREELDWAERGHQVALPELVRAEGDVVALVPVHLPPPERKRLTDHLRHSVSIIATEALQAAVDGDAPPTLTLADLARPCPQCGGWLDPKGRCPACVELDWRRQQIRTALERLRSERHEVIEDLERFRSRMPVLRRQLMETEAEIEALRQKGVEPT